MKKENLKALDIIKLIMSIFVVSIHTEPLLGVEKNVIYDIWWVLAEIAVPVFFISTGYFITREYRTTKKSYSFILKKYCIKYLKIYLVWSIIYLPLAVVYYIENKYTLIDAIKGYLWELVFSGQHYNSWILWYILSSLYTFVVLWILFFINNKWSKGNIKIVLLFFSLIFMFAYIFMHIIRGLSDIHSFYRLFIGGVYIPIGMIVYDGLQMKELKRWICYPCLILSTIVSILLRKLGGVALAIFIVFTWISAISFFILVISSKVQIMKSTVGLRKVSGYVYYIHLWIWTIYYMTIYGKKQYGIDSFIVVVVVSLSVSTLWYKFLQKIDMRMSKKSLEP